jgi:catecholate siderophore receptor
MRRTTASSIGACPSAGPGTVANPAGPLRGFRDTFFGDPRINDSTFDAHVLKARVEHQFSDALTLTSGCSTAIMTSPIRNVFPATPVLTNAATGARTVGIEAYRDPTRRENLISQTDLVWQVETGPLAHTLLGGVEIANQETRNERINGFFVGVPTTSSGRRTVVPLTDPLAVPAVAFRAGRPAPATARCGPMRTCSLSTCRTQVSIGPMVDLIAGLRYDRFQASGHEPVHQPDLFAHRRPLVAAAGPCLQADRERLALASYSRSFLPQSGDQFLSLDLTSAALEPEKFDNYELGLKWEPRPAGLHGRRLPARSHQHPREPRRRRGGAERRAAQPRDRAAAHRRHHPQLAPERRLCATGGRGPHRHRCLRQR